MMSHFYSAVQEQIMEVLRACAEEKSWRVRYMMVRNLDWDFQGSHVSLTIVEMSDMLTCLIRKHLVRLL